MDGLINDTVLLDISADPASRSTLRAEVPTSVVVGDKRLTDITSQFIRAATELPPGRLVKDGTFALFDSVGALEVMDPKMDNGALAPGETFYDDFDVLQDLAADEVVWIMDQLLRYEMAWHQGYSLSQTLFTSQYIENLIGPETRSSAEVDFHDGLGNRPNYEEKPMLFVLKAYCLALIKCCDLSAKIARSSECFEEEDFSPHSFNRDLLSSFPTKDICDIVTAAESLANVQGERAICSRMQVRLDLLIMLESEPLPDYIKDNILLADLPQKYADIANTHAQGRSKPSAFSRKIQRKLASSAPPRPIVEIAFEEAICQLTRLRQEAHQHVRIYDVLASRNAETLQFFLLDSGAQRPERLPLSRSRTSAALANQPAEYFPELMKRELKLIAFPNNEVIDPENWTVEAPMSLRASRSARRDLARTIDEFVSGFLPDFGGYRDYWRALCSNRCRLRRILTHVLIGLDFSQRLADGLDPVIGELVDDSDNLLPEALFQWSTFQKDRVSSWVVQLGFELDIYRPEELAGMYWLLGVISKHRIMTIMSILEFYEALLSGPTLTADEVADKRRQTVQSVAFLRTQLAIAEGNDSFADGLYGVYVCLHYLQLCPDAAASQAYCDLALRYELRMKPFLRLQDGYKELFEGYKTALYPFGKYEAPDLVMLQSGVLRDFCDISGKMLQNALEKFRSLKNLGASAAGVSTVEREWLADISAHEASTAEAFEVLSQLRTIITAEGAPTGEEYSLEVPEPGKRHHNWWIVPNLVPKA